MKNDYTYCLNKDETCIHRRGCKRWIGNYSNDEVKEFYTENRFVSEVDETKCIPNYKDKDCENNFEFLDRFRLSNGNPNNTHTEKTAVDIYVEKLMNIPIGQITVEQWNKPVSKELLDGLSEIKLVSTKLRDMSLNSLWTLEYVSSQFIKNNPTDFDKWSKNISIDINISASICFNNGVLAPKWMRKYLKGKNEYRK